MTRGSSLGRVAGPRGLGISAPPPKMAPSYSPPRNCPPGPPLQPLPLEPWCPRSTEWWRIGAAEGRGVSRKARRTSRARQRASAIPGFCPPPPTAIPTPQGTVKSQDSAGRGLEVPGGARRGQRWSFHGSSSCPGLPSPPAHSMYLGLGFTPETWVSSPHSCHCDPASTLTRAKQAVRVGLTTSRAVPSSPDIATAVRSARFQPGECQLGHTVQPGITWQAGVGSGQRAPLPRPQMK